MCWKLSGKSLFYLEEKYEVIKSRDSSVGIATRLPAGRSGL
jgi:hypothetical protein